MSGGGATGLVTMKATAVFPQPTSHMPAQHTQAAGLQPNSVIQANSVFNQQMQQQHLLQQQQQQQQQQQRAQQHTQAQHQQLHRLSQPHSISATHPSQTTAAVNNAQTSVFPPAEFFQTLQQTAAALPTVLPYDQSQYIGQLMYFPYPTAAAAAANGLFGSPSATDSQHITVCSAAQVAPVNVVNQVSSNNTGQIIGGPSLVSTTPGGMVALNHAAAPSGQVHSATHLLTSGPGIVGLGAGSNTVSGTPALAPASLAPLFTTAHFYPHHQQSQDQASQSQLQLQHSLQQQHIHNPLQMQQHIHTLSGHSAMHGQVPSTTPVIVPGQVHPSGVAQLNAVNSQVTNSQRHLNNTAGNGTTCSTTTNSSNTNSNTPVKNSVPNCDGTVKPDDPVHSTPNQTPVKGNESDMLNQNSQLTGQSQNSNSGLDVSSSSTKRDNSGTGHFVCSVCGREFGMRCRLIAHTRRHTGERPFPCADCGRAFSDRGNLQRHRYTHSSQPRFHCSVCGKSFRQASCLSNHRRFHCAGATGRPCPFCQRSFRSSSSLQMHIRWKHREDAAAAVAAAAAAAAVSGTTSISDAFSYLPGLTSYVPTVSMNGLPPMSMNGGGSLDLQGSSLLSAAAAVAASAAVVNNSSMVSGMSLHSTSGTACTSTTAATSTLSYAAPFSMLNPIMTTSTSSPNKRKWRRKPKPKQNAFGKITGDGMNILAGINLSEGIDVNAAAAAAGAAAAAVGGPVPLDRKGRPCNFPCPACPRRFAFQCRLAAHLRCHTNIRPFICIDCGRAFTQRGYLVRHAAVHKLDRPFTCGLCDRSYKHYGSLVNHKRTHSKMGVSGMGNIALLSSSTVDQLGCDVSTTTVTGLSSLEEVVAGTVVRSEKTDGSDPLGSTATSTTTITLLPVSKVEEILPTDLGSSLQQVCLPSGNLMNLSDRHHTEGVSYAQSHSLPHQLTATAVWPILASGNPTPQTQMLASTNVSQTMVSASHFPSITISPSQGIQAGQPNPHQLSIATSQRQQQQIPQSGNTTMLSAATATPAFVTVPLFGSQPQVEGSETATSHHPHNPFHGASSLVSTAPASDASQTAHPHQQSIAQSAQMSVHHPGTSQTQSTPGDANSNTPVLHVLQPSPSIFFSSYYLPHTAASQM
ncbi:zinc finger protein 557 [Clonorchis sinensis]|uniref:Zinc finger protein 557 n=2 Tax=Clonorchis sinensis TaxID=79923 RepID=G7YJ89_CLOSI|nr:zinc finger protein 557 [Clonorchis sinensis]